jgi:uncharacterized 2Fe-2S/4Fe-4S cluster protein (DUF4445 family)
MKTTEVKVTFQPSGRSIYVLPGTLLLEAAGRAGIILQTPCGGNGTCGKCKVIINGNSVLACQERVEEAVTVEIPESSMFEARQQILTSDSGETATVDPFVKVVPFSLHPPSHEDPRSDTERLLEAIGPDIYIPLDVMRRLPGCLRQNQWQGRAIVAGKRLLTLDCAPTPLGAFGVAFDLGTTTVVGTLFDLDTGKECTVSSHMNGQIAHGDDVIARIQAIRDEAKALETLQTAIIGTLNTIIDALCEQANVPAETIYEVVVAGNSTMQQILLRLDPSALGEVPFVQVFDRAITTPASHLGLHTNPEADAYIFPQVGGFVGGDTVAGMVATRIDRHDKPVVLIDIGTNGEIVLANGNRLYATSTAAGPAFEGARIKQGMRAAPGAIEKVILNDDVKLNVIGNQAPAGLCGTALIDTVAELLRTGIIDETGRIVDADECPESTSEAVRNRIVEQNGENHFVLASADMAAGDEPICLWQKDVRELQLASGAIRAGVSILLKRAGLAAHDLGEVLLAGAFGNFIRRNHARRIGLLPPLPTERIRFIGNAASLGAKFVLLSAAERRYADQLCHSTEHVDLSLDADFQLEFSMAMMFPGPEADG